MNSKTIWKIITVIEFAAILATVLLDLFIPTLVIIGLMVVSLLIRREHLAVMGFKRPISWLGMAGFIFSLPYSCRCLNFEFVSILCTIN